MKTALIAATLIALSAAGASAVELQTSIGRQLYTCSGGPLSRVALTNRVDPAPCCTGMLGCPQLLSNSGLVKPRADNRT